MRIAYIILAHKNPQQLERLVSRLNGEETSFFIHIDKKAPQGVYRESAGALGHLPNVRFLKRYVSRWGEFGLVRAALEGIGEAVRAHPPVDYVALLTGQDYPIKPNRYIDTFLEGSGGRSYVDYHSVPSKAWPEAATRMRSWHVRILGRPFLLPRRNATRAMLRTPRKWPILVLSYCMPKGRRPLRGYTPFTGSAHWVISSACARHVDDFVRRETSFVKYFKRVCCPDELFFQTLLLNSYPSDEIVAHNLHYLDWSTGGAHPATLTADDLDALAASSALFARKFDADVDRDLLDRIDQGLLAVPPHE
jgi:hypothetical protein